MSFTVPRIRSEHGSRWRVQAVAPAAAKVYLNGSVGKDVDSPIMRCIHCGNAVKTGEPSCRHCGARVVRPSIETSSSGRRSFAPVAMLVFVLLGAAAAVWVSSGQRVPSTPVANDSADQAPTVAPPPQPASAPPVAALPPQQEPAPAAVPAAPVAPTTQPTTSRPAPRSASAEPPRAAAVTKPDAPQLPRAVPTPAAAPQAPPAATSQPVRVGGNIAAPKKLRDVPPSYPPMAVQARVQGIVIIEATIGGDGTVRTARVLRSVPLLDEAALDAVRQWEYAPTLLNGVPVPVIMTVTVNFSLK